MARETDVERKIRYLQEIHQAYLRKDIKDFAQIEQPVAFNRLVQLMALQVGGLVNLTALTRELRITRPTLERYLFLLENTFILKLLPPFFTNKRKEITRMRKVFFLDSGLRNMVLRQFESIGHRPDMGALVENAVFSELTKSAPIMEGLRFWRSQSKNEVDFVLEEAVPTPIEVKYRSFHDPIVPPGIRSFLQSYPSERAYVLTRDYFGSALLGRTPILFIPTWMR